MKKILIPVLACAIAFAACNNETKKDDNTNGTMDSRQDTTTMQQDNMRTNPGNTMDTVNRKNSMEQTDTSRNQR